MSFVIQMSVNRMIKCVIKERGSNIMSKGSKKPSNIKNEIITLEIGGLSSEGYGVGKDEGFTFFVKGALPGEKIEAKIIKLTKTYGIARLMNIIKVSEDRTKPRCSSYKRCGGCHLQHMSYKKQLEYKSEKVSETLGRIGKIQLDESISCIGMDNPYRYRNKSQMPAAMLNGKPVFGFYADRSHDIVPITDCLILREENREIVEEITAFIDENKISIYDETSHKGLVRHLVIRESFQNNSLLVCLVINGNKLTQSERLIDKLSKKPNIAGILINCNRERTNVILGEKTTLIYGEEYIYDVLGGLTFRISIKSFFQVNPVQTEVLYRKAIEYGNISKDDTVLDAYCGIGTISLLAAMKAKKVYGVEVVAEAIQDANYNSRVNGIDNTEFIQGKAEDVIESFIEKGVIIDIVIVDPPRKGCDVKFLKAVTDLKPKKFLYVSCNPSTLARDLNYLAEYGYEVTKVQAVDCFPMTWHVESIVLMTRQNG